MLMQTDLECNEEMARKKRKMKRYQHEGDHNKIR